MRQLYTLSSLLGCMALFLVACSGPRQSVMDPAQAKRDQRALRVKVVKVYDNFNQDYFQGPRVGHVIDVDVIDGPFELQGKGLTLPYDSFELGAPPPKEGDEVVMTPSDWVTQPAARKFRMREK